MCVNFCSKEKRHLNELDEKPIQDSKQQEALVETVIENEFEEGVEASMEINEEEGVSEWLDGIF
jgi:hypothetical protein